MRSKRPTAKQLEVIWKKAVKERAMNKCEYHRGPRAYTRQACEGYLHAHHISGKRTIKQKTALENGIAVCAGAHFFIAHEDRGCGTRAAEFKRWAADVREVSIDDLERLGHMIDADNFEIKEQLEAALCLYKQRPGPVIIGAKPKRGRKKRGDNG